MSNRRFDPDKIIDYNVDYYAVLGLERGCLPAGSNRKERQEISDILEKGFRWAARTAHPAVPGGSEDKFKLVVRAQTILGDPLLRRIYESGGKDRPLMVGDEGASFEVNWDTVGTYRQDTLEDTTGFSLFVTLSERADELGIVPAFFPQTPDHNYEWDWAVPDQQAKLALSIVNDETEVLKLTTRESAETDSLPFKIHICIPRAALFFVRGEKEVYDHGNGVVDVLNGKLMGAAYSDYSLLETTRLVDAVEYVTGHKIVEDMRRFRSGELRQELIQKEKETSQLKWVNTEKMKERDISMIRAILMQKAHKVVKAAPDAANFLDELPDE